MAIHGEGQWLRSLRIVGAKSVIWKILTFLRPSPRFGVSEVVPLNKMHALQLSTLQDLLSWSILERVVLEVQPDRK